MMKKLKFLIIPFLGLFSLCFADETLTVVSYYPAPYGSYNQVYVSDKLGIGTTSPGARLSFNNLNDGSNAADGITWSNLSPLVYGIYRTAGPWTGPDYQQLELAWATGVVIDGGSAYGKSGTVLQPGGGRVGIGTTVPTQTLDVAGYIKAQHPFFIASSTDGWRAGGPGWVTVIHNSVIAGNSGGWYNTSNGRFTAPVAGIYLFTTQHYVYSNASGAPYIHHLIGVNGSWNGAGYTSNSGGYTIYGENMGNYEQSTSTTTLLSLNAGDYVNDNVYVSSGAYNYMYGAYSYFQGVLLYAQ